MFDTHCHLNFDIFRDTVSQVVARAKAQGVDQMVVVGTTLENSRRAVELAREHHGMYAAVGVHPHKAFSFLEENRTEVLARVHTELEKLLAAPEVKAIGEIGFDRWPYPKTHYDNYQVSAAFLELQRELFNLQLELALEYNKSVVIHNRQAVDELLAAFNAFFVAHPGSKKRLEKRVVFHCCEPDQRLLDFAVAHQWYVGVAGDVTYDVRKQTWISHVPLESLVLETDAPFFKPRTDERTVMKPSRQRKKEISELSDTIEIAQTVADLSGKTISEIEAQTTANARRFLNL